eukprot:3001-Prymnesium_polylepis.1
MSRGHSRSGGSLRPRQSGKRLVSSGLWVRMPGALASGCDRCEACLYQRRGLIEAWGLRTRGVS